MKKLKKIKTKIFADGANINEMINLSKKEFIKGLTTNPSLMKKAGIKDYEKFAKTVIKKIKKPVSFEVFSDNLDEMYKQAKKISSWGRNIYVKIPICNTKKKYTYKIIKKLSDENVKLNVTALMTLDQVKKVTKSLNRNTPAYISVFAGRVADTGVDPVRLMKQSVKIMKLKPKSELIWASPRELYNIFQANEIGCQIITITNDILKKLNLIGYNLDKYSLDTVKTFRSDALKAGFKL